MLIKNKKLKYVLSLSLIGSNVYASTSSNIFASNQVYQDSDIKIQFYVFAGVSVAVGLATIGISAYNIYQYCISPNEVVALDKKKQLMSLYSKDDFKSIFIEKSPSELIDKNIELSLPEPNKIKHNQNNQDTLLNNSYDKKLLKVEEKNQPKQSKILKKLLIRISFSKDHNVEDAELYIDGILHLNMASRGNFSMIDFQNRINKRLFVNYDATLINELHHHIQNNFNKIRGQQFNDLSNSKFFRSEFLGDRVFQINGF